MKTIVAIKGTTALLVARDVDEAVHLSHRIVVMRPDPGRVGVVPDVPEEARRDRSNPAFVTLRDDVFGRLGVHRH